MREIREVEIRNERSNLMEESLHPTRKEND
jgi:hypothetical protein